MKSVSRTAVVLALLWTGCGRPPAEEYLKKAQEAEKGGLWSVAIENYRDLAKDHPDDTLAESALFTIAAIEHNNLQNFQAAVDGYKLYLEKFPRGKKAAVAMFLTAFLYNNELKNLDSAKVFYQRFLATYPNDEMASSAQFELNNLGKSPDEILPKPEVVAEKAPAKATKPPARKATKK
jgi:TolA-binding protein